MRGSFGIKTKNFADNMVGADFIVALRSLGSVAGLKGLTTTRAGSGRRYKLWRFMNRDCDKRHLGLFKMRLCERRWNPIWTGVSSGLSQYYPLIDESPQNRGDREKKICHLC